MVTDDVKKKAAKECVSSFYCFIRNFWGVINQDKYVDNWHVRYIADYLQAQTFAYIRGDEIDLNVIINIPPGMSKSTIISQMFPCWFWLHMPECVVISTSYSPAIAIDNSIKSKEIILSEKFHYYFDDYYRLKFGKVLKIVKNTEKDWRNNFNGMRYATATGGALTGKHGHLILRDDPMSAANTDSKTYIDYVHKFNDIVLPSRMKNKERTPIYTIMQRLHEDDTTGHELTKENKKIKHICLPAELSDKVLPTELASRYVDGLLDPRRLNRKVLGMQKADLGLRAFSGQYAQNPVIEGGNIVKRDWLPIMDVSDFSYLSRANNAVVHFFLDTAYTKENRNDPTGIISATSINGKVYIIEAVKVNKEFPELIKFIPSWVRSNDYTNESTVRVEPKANGLSIIQQLKDITDLNITKTAIPKDSKETRLHSNTGIIECGRVVLVRGSWNESFLTEVTGFPAMQHDEYVDLMNYAIDFFIKQEPNNDLKGLFF